jgi:hypothetical protein
VKQAGWRSYVGAAKVSASVICRRVAIGGYNHAAMAILHIT